MINAAHWGGRAAVSATLLATSLPLSAVEVIAVGESVLRGNIAAAREEAVRSALAEAVRSQGVSVHSTTVAGYNTLEFEHTQLSAQRFIRRYEILDQHSTADSYVVRLKADMVDPQEHASTEAKCQGGYINRIVIGGFPLERPTDLLPNELGGYAHLTSDELRRRLAHSRSVLPVGDSGLMLRAALPDQLGVGSTVPVQAWAQVREYAERHRAQFVLVGMFRSLRLAVGQKRRDLVLDALIVDGFSGTCVARARFEREAHGQVILPPEIIFGSSAFAASGLGEAYSRLADDVSAWAEKTADCLPFATRVLKVESGLVYLDAGAEQGLSVGDQLLAFKARGTPVTTRAGEILGSEKSPVGDLRIRDVYPRFAIAEMPDFPQSFMPLPLRAGDEAHAQ